MGQDSEGQGEPGGGAGESGLRDEAAGPATVDLGSARTEGPGDAVPAAAPAAVAEARDDPEEDDAPGPATVDMGRDDASEHTPEQPLDQAAPAGPEAGGPVPPPSPTRPGRMLAGRYRLTDVVGRGGMGTVWRARDEILGRWVAVKELRFPGGVDEAERRRLITRTMREAKAIASIRSPGVVTVYDIVEERSRPWIVMELIEGRSLADVIRGEGPMPPGRAARIGLAVLEVLRAAHAVGIVHRDVKPSNVLVADEDGRVVLTDFGIAKVEGDPSITSTGMLVGAPSYISPERARGEVPGPAADMWSLGALLYCCVEGAPPYDEGSAIATLAAVMHDPVPPPRKAGPLREVITGLLTKTPAGRLDEPRARDMLQAALAGTAGVGEGEHGAAGEGRDQRTVAVGLRATGTSPPGAPPGPEPVTLPAAPPPDRRPVPRPDRRDRRRPLLVAAVALLVMALLGGALAVVLLNDGAAGSGDDTTTQPTGNSATGDSDTGDSDTGESPGSGDTGDSDASEDADGTDGSAPPATSPESDPDASLPSDPAGYSEVTDEDFHFRISLPDGWERTGIAGENSGGIYSAPDGGPPKVQVDFTSSPGDSAEAAWRAQEQSVRDSSTDYERLSIESVEWRDYPTVADWEFERTEDGQRVRVLNRGFVVDEDHGYAIMITCPADEWDGAECRTLRETAFETFQPWDGEDAGQEDEKAK